jgi:energy-converting hydrogenase Eha subunit G
LKIVIAGVINGHVAAKSLYVRIFAGTDRMHKRDWVAMGSWVGIAFGLWVIAWVIAEAIPVFNNLLSLIVRVSASSTLESISDLCFESTDCTVW